DALDENDLRRIALAGLAAESIGRRLLYRTSPGLLRARLGQEPHPPLEQGELRAAILRAKPATEHGLVVVGSHVPLSSRQLADLLRTDHTIEHVVLDVPSLLEPATAQRTIADLIDLATVALRTHDVVLSTSRERIDGADGDASLHIARRVSMAIVTVTAEIVRRARPSFVVGKGGITSSDLATGAIGLQRATILGSVLPGMISLWQSGDPGLSGASPTPYAVFPGNVGDDSALTRVVSAFRAAAKSTG
ncbi:MAG TPA: nucleotide-binding domain containing protein, partial [Glaciihabitans sp.]|nr:nucleotide-binding domain containing protein [Glaciihabitans sp.]